MQQIQRVVGALGMALLVSVTACDTNENTGDNNRSMSQSDNDAKKPVKSSGSDIVGMCATIIDRITACLPEIEAAVCAGFNGVCYAVIKEDAQTACEEGIQDVLGMGGTTEDDLAEVEKLFTDASCSDLASLVAPYVDIMYQAAPGTPPNASERSGYIEDIILDILKSPALD